MRKNLFRFMTAILAAITFIAIIPIASCNSNATTTYTYKRRQGGLYFEGSYFGNHVEYSNKYVYYYPENYSGNDADVLFLIHGMGGPDRIEDPNMEQYLSNWVNNYAIRPVVVICPKILQICDDGKPKDMNIFDYKHFVLEGPMTQLLDAVKSGRFSKASSSSNLYLTGYSMGATCALYASTVLDGRYQFKGIGAFSPSVHFFGSNDHDYYYRVNSSIPYRSNTDCYFFSYGTNESSEYRNNATSYYQDVHFKVPGVRNVLKGVDFYNEVLAPDQEPNEEPKQHQWSLFRKEVFAFLYYVNHNYNESLLINERILASDNLTGYVWPEPTESNSEYWGPAIPEDNGNSGSQTIADVQQGNAQKPLPKYYTVSYYVNKTLVCTALVQENCPIPKYPSKMPAKYQKDYVWYYGVDAHARQVVYTNGVTRDTNVNGVKIK